MKGNSERRERRLRILAASLRRHEKPFAAVSKQDSAPRGESAASDSSPEATEAASAVRLCFAEAVGLQETDKLEDAVRLYQRALELNPDAVERGAIYCNLGHALLSLNRRREALELCEQAIALLPENLEALSNLGNVLMELGRFEEARGVYETALKRNPEWLPALHGMGAVLLEEGRYDEALKSCERTLALDPNLAEARLNRGILRLLRGEFSTGWADYDTRLESGLKAPRAKTPRLGGEAPLWRGEPLNGDSILLYAEQGLGDAIQLLRYVPQVVESGGEVTLVLHSRLMRLAEGLKVCVIPQGDPLPKTQWQSPLMSLPLAIGRGGGGWEIPAWKPYLDVPAGERARSRSFAWAPDALRVGLIWAGSPDHTRDWARSLSLDQLEPLLMLAGAQFYSLQVGPAVRQIERWQERIPRGIIDLAPVEHDMADTAAKILELDLVIAVDTAVAHLAGALSKQVWLLLPWVPDWRWQLEREDSPWYPSMRLFRQPERQAWGPVITCVREALLALIESGWRGKGRGGEEIASDDPAHDGKAYDDEASAKAVHSETYAAQMRMDSAVERHDVEEQSTLLPAVESFTPRPCKICRGRSPLFGVVDFHKSCMEGQGKRLTLSGVPVYYRRCEQCGFLATDFFDVWPDAAFAEHVYNADYIKVDPDFLELRPTGNAGLIAGTFAGAQQSISILDYGGGSGRLAELLRERGFAAETYDPFSQHCVRPGKRFDLITSFEVLEHAPDPHGTAATMASLLKTREEDGEDGLLLFSTLLQPEDIVQTATNWWYVAPRNGHCSLYSANALARLFASVGMQVASSNASLHLAYRRIPGFARHLRIGTVQEEEATASRS